MAPPAAVCFRFEAAPLMREPFCFFGAPPCFCNIFRLPTLGGPRPFAEPLLIDERLPDSNPPHTIPQVNGSLGLQNSISPLSWSSLSPLHNRSFFLCLYTIQNTKLLENFLISVYNIVQNQITEYPHGSLWC